MQPASCLPKELPEEEGELPPYIAVEDITRASKFSAHTVRKHVHELGLAEKIGGRLWIAREKLRDGWPTLYERLRELLGRGQEQALSERMAPTARPASPAVPCTRAPR